MTRISMMVWLISLKDISADFVLHNDWNFH